MPKDGCQSLAAHEGTSRSLVFRVASVIGFSHQNITDSKDKKKKQTGLLLQKRKNQIFY